MEPSEQRSGLLEALEESLDRDKAVTFAVVFGSQATGETVASSDIDIAIKFSETLSSHGRFQKRCFLAGDLQRADAPFVDVSDIEKLPLDLAHDAVNGELLCGDRQAFEAFKRKVESAFEDERDDIRRHQRDIIDRIAEDGLHG